MGLLKRLLVRERKTYADSTFAALIAAPATASGKLVSAETALRCVPVYACVQVIAQSIASLPLHLYKRLANGGKERADHPLAEILHDQANDWTSAYDFRVSMQQDLLLRGNCFAAIVRADDRVRELVQLPAASVTVEADAAGEPQYFVTGSDGTRRQWPRADLLHLRGQPDTRTPCLGLSPITQCREAVALSLVLEEHAGRLFGSGARPGGVLESDKQLSGPVIERLKTSFEGGFAGSVNSGKTAILEDGLKFKPLTLNSTDAQFLETRKFQIAEIARVFRVPLHKIGELDRATFSNIEHQALEFISDCLMPHIKNWEQAIRRSLLTEEERGEYFAEFLVDDLVRGDLKARYEALASALAAGFLTANEARALENRPPLPGGDVLRAPLNTAPAGSPPPS